MSQYLAGAPSFAFFAKGGYNARIAAGFVWNGQKLRRCSIAAHPFDRLRAGSCKERKNGDPPPRKYR